MLESAVGTHRPQLKADPDWRDAAQRLVNALNNVRDEEKRIWLLYRIAEDLGDDFYPALIKILCAVERFGDINARRLVSDVLHYALKTWRFPPAKTALWGGLNRDEISEVADALEIGPLDYLLVRRFQDNGNERLTTEAFRSAATLLLSLIAISPGGLATVGQHLRYLTDHSAAGAFAGPTLSAFAQTADDLINNVSPQMVVERLLRLSEVGVQQDELEAVT